MARAKDRLADRRRARRQALVHSVTLTREQEQEIDDLYLTNYGKKVPYDWHRMYTSYTGHFDARYIPELLFIPKIEKMFNSMECREVFSDKNLLPLLVNGIPGARTPQTLFCCQAGCYRDGEGKLVSRQQARDILSALGQCFIKPSVDSCSGNDCAILDMHNARDERSGKTADELLDYYGRDFVVQELLHTADSVRRLHPASANTFRVMSYVWGGD